MTEVLRCKRGLLFSIDAMIAAVVAAILITSINVISSNINQPEFADVDLYNLASDSLVALKEQGELDQVVATGSGARFQTYSSVVLQPQVCAMLRIYDERHIKLHETVRNGCSYDPPKKIKAESPLIVDGQIYSAEIVMWYK